MLLGVLASNVTLEALIAFSRALSVDDTANDSNHRSMKLSDSTFFIVQRR